MSLQFTRCHCQVPDVRSRLDIAEDQIVREAIRQSRKPFFLAQIRTFFPRAWGAIHHIIALLTISLGVLGASSQRAAASPQVVGSWVTLPYLMPINPIRLDLLRNGKLLIVAGSENDPINIYKEVRKQRSGIYRRKHLTFSRCFGMSSAMAEPFSPTDAAWLSAGQ